ncbi:GtrA family protein [uncultured Pseudoteredinibacter sp.]|uniref:GtrA family protein n=1 Tax=uncultured Pseudoteredinibacter sp. TaxID=1641701 RepID=UPI0034371655
MAYGGSGLVATSLHYAVFCLVLMWSDAFNASVLGAFLGSLLSYWLNANYTFPSKDGRRLSKCRFFIVALLNNVINAVIMLVGLGNFPDFPFSIQLFSTFFVFLFGFFVNLCWSYSYE